MLGNKQRLGELLLANDFAGLKELFTAFFASIPNDWYRNNHIASHEGYYASVFDAYASLHKDPESFAREMRIAAAVRWYARRELSQKRAAELAGLSRPAFVDALGRYEVSTFQLGHRFGPRGQG